MKKFNFKLETLRRYRKNLEDQERTKFSSIHLEFRCELDHLEELQAKHHETLRELAKKLEDAKQDEVSWFYVFLDRLCREMEQSRKRIEQLDRELMAQKEVLVEASKKKKILDTLKTKKEREFITAQEKEEQKAIDEIVVTRFTPKDR